MRFIALSTLLAILLGACSGGNGSTSVPAEPPATRAAAQLLTPTPEFQPVTFPADEAPHDYITEWWYYTGHLFTPDGARYGFEFVFFQVRFGAFPTTYAAHFAITDNAREVFSYAERTGMNASIPAEGFHLQLGDWEMRGVLGRDQLRAALEGYAIDLNLTDEKGPVLHNEIGYVDFGASGSSYYYSRTRIDVAGELVVDGDALPVTGEAWMDHQWGNFISVGGGWDWFAVQLDNNEELTISLVRDNDFSVAIAYGTLVRADGSAENLTAQDIVVTPDGEWTSPHSGAVYPARWTIELPQYEWNIQLEPSLPDQELDTRASTGTIYWEGEVEVNGVVGVADVAGLGYVELTGYAAGGLFDR